MAVCCYKKGKLVVNHEHPCNYKDKEKPVTFKEWNLVVTMKI